MANSRGTPGNLKPYKPGQSGNPGGKPKGQSVTARLRELLDEKAGKPIKVKTRRDEIAKGIFEEALARDHKFVETLLDRTEGKVAQPVETNEVTMEDVARMQEADEHCDPDEPGNPPPQVP